MQSVLILFSILQAVTLTVFVMVFLQWRKETQGAVKDSKAWADKSVTTVKAIADAHNSVVQQIETLSKEHAEIKTALAFLRGKR